jgi:hypothetical protein
MHQRNRRGADGSAQPKGGRCTSAIDGGKPQSRGADAPAQSAGAGGISAIEGGRYIDATGAGRCTSATEGDRIHQRNRGGQMHQRNRGGQVHQRNRGGGRMHQRNRGGQMHQRNRRRSSAILNNNSGEQSKDKSLQRPTETAHLVCRGSADVAQAPWTTTNLNERQQWRPIREYSPDNTNSSANKYDSIIGFPWQARVARSTSKLTLYWKRDLD